MCVSGGWDCPSGVVAYVRVCVPPVRVSGVLWVCPISALTCVHTLCKLLSEKSPNQCKELLCVPSVSVSGGVRVFLISISMYIHMCVLLVCVSGVPWVCPISALTYVRMYVQPSF